MKQLSGQAHEEGEAVVKKSGTPEENHDVEDTSPPKLEAEERPENATYILNNIAPPMEKDFGTLVISDEGRSRYVNHNFWARVTEEVYLRHLVPC